LLLVEDPFIFDGSDDDFGGLAAAHVLGVAHEVELRSGNKASEEHGVTAGKWLRGMHGIDAKDAIHAYEAATNNGFQTTMPEAPEDRAMLMFRRLCIFNHSCLPNCGVFRDDSSGQARVFVLREVCPGEELMIHYSDDLLLIPTPLRARFLRARFGFECKCPRCIGTNPMGMMIENALEDVRDASRTEEAFRAHKSICKAGSVDYREFDGWAEALAAVDAAMPKVAACGNATWWVRHHTRALKCLALEGLGRDVAAFLALAEHAESARRLLPPYCQALLDLQRRVEACRERLPEALRSRLEGQAAQSHGDGIRGLARDVERLRGWLGLAQ